MALATATIALLRLLGAYALLVLMVPAIVPAIIYITRGQLLKDRPLSTVCLFNVLAIGCAVGTSVQISDLHAGMAADRLAEFLAKDLPTKEAIQRYREERQALTLFNTPNSLGFAVAGLFYVAAILNMACVQISASQLKKAWTEELLSKAAREELKLSQINPQPENPAPPAGHTLPPTP